jgi:hypothetical protein
MIVSKHCCMLSICLVAQPDRQDRQREREREREINALWLTTHVIDGSTRMLHHLEVMHQRSALQVIQLAYVAMRGLRHMD